MNEFHGRKQNNNNNNNNNNKGTAPLDGRARVQISFGDDKLLLELATIVNTVFKCKYFGQKLPKMFFFVFIKKVVFD